MSVCEMIDCKGTLRRKHLSTVEIEVEKSWGYFKLARKAAARLHVTAPVGGELALLKYNGARILDNPLMVDGQRKAWTVGYYLWVLKKSPSAGNKHAQGGGGGGGHSQPIYKCR